MIEPIVDRIPHPPGLRSPEAHEEAEQMRGACGDAVDDDGGSQKGSADITIADKAAFAAGKLAGFLEAHDRKERKRIFNSTYISCNICFEQKLRGRVLSIPWVSDWRFRFFRHRIFHGEVRNQIP